MNKRTIACLLLLSAFAVNASNGRAGCPGGTSPDPSGHFYLPGTKKQCNPGKQDAMKSARQ